MSPDTETVAGGATYYAQARAMREAGLSAAEAHRRLQAAGMEANRALELVESLYGSPAKAAGVATVRAVGRGTHSVSRSIAAGVAAALVGALVWGAVVGITGWNFGIVAWGLGAAVGFATYAATPEEHRSYEHLPWIACGVALFGIVVGQYLGFIFTAARLRPDKFSAWDALNPAAVSLYFNNLSKLMSPFGLLWIALAMYSAYKIAAQDV